MHQSRLNQVFPRHLLYKIFEFLDPIDLVKLRSVNYLFYTNLCAFVQVNQQTCYPLNNEVTIDVDTQTYKQIKGIFITIVGEDCGHARAMSLNNYLLKLQTAKIGLSAYDIHNHLIYSQKLVYIFKKNVSKQIIKRTSLIQPELLQAISTIEIYPDQFQCVLAQVSVVILYS